MTPLQPLISETVLHRADAAGLPGFVINQPSYTWYFYLLVFMTIGYIVARKYLGSMLSSIFTASVRYNNASGMFNDNSQLQRHRDQVLDSLYFVNMAFFLMLLSGFYHIKPYGLNGFKLLLIYTGMLVAFYLIRILLASVTGHVFFISQLLKKHLYMGFTYNKLMGILLLPLNFMIVYIRSPLNKYVLFFALLVILTILFMRIIRGIELTAKERILNLYLFLYLCALEIVPVLLFYKWFSTIV